MVIKSISWILLFSMIFYCCSTTHTVMRHQTTYDRLNEKTKENEVKITMLDHTVIDAENITISGDSICWIEKHREGPDVWKSKMIEISRAFPIDDVESISITNNTNRKWILFGCSTAGTFIGWAVSPKGEAKTTKGFEGLFAFSGYNWAGAIIGALVGIGIGAFIVPPPTDTYILSIGADSTLVE